MNNAQTKSAIGITSTNSASLSISKSPSKGTLYMPSISSEIEKLQVENLANIAYIQEQAKNFLYSSISTDWEFLNKLVNQHFSEFTKVEDYRKTITELTPVLVGISVYASNNKEDIDISNPDCKLGEVIVLEHPEHRQGLFPTWEGESLITWILGVKEVETPVIMKKKMPLFIVPLLFFFSALDPLLDFRTREVAKRCYKQLVKHRTTKVNPKLKCRYLKTGIFVERDGEIQELAIDLKDQSGKGAGSLEKQLDSLGITMPDKDLMKDHKEDMLSAYINPKLTVDFVKYTKGDVPANFQMNNLTHLKMQDASHQLGLPYPIKSFNTVASGTSRSVVGMLGKKLEPSTFSFFDDEGMTEQGKHKLGQMLTPQSGHILAQYGGNVKTLLSTDGGFCKNMTPRRVRIKLGSLVLDIDLKGCYMEGMVVQSYPVGRPIIQVHQSKEVRLTLREWLEKTEVNLVPNCWMARISTRTVKTETKSKGKGVEEIFHRYKLSFEQDLFVSKHFDSVITGAFEEEFADDSFYQIDPLSDTDKNKADFMLTTRELSYALLTHDLLQAIRTCATTSELDEILDNTVVESAWYYPKDKQVHSADEFFQRFTDVIDANNPDNNVWLELQMRDIAQPFIDLRSKEKVAKKVASALLDGKSVEEKDMDAFLSFHGHDEEYWRAQPPEILKKFMRDHDAGQYTYKITGLTIYGTAGSFHYQTEEPLKRKVKGEGWKEVFNPKHGHYLVSNHITARARVAVWALSKVLNTAVVITDGGMFNINETRVWNWTMKNASKMGLDILSRMTNDKLSNAKLSKSLADIQNVPLGGQGQWTVSKAWTEVKDEKDVAYIEITNGDKTFILEDGEEGDLAGLDAIAFEQVSKQFAGMDIFDKKQVRFASKALFGGAGIQSQANYVLTPIEHEGVTFGQYNHKMRGQQLHKSAYSTPGGRSASDKLSEHPAKTLLNDILNNPNSVAPCMEFYGDRILSVNEFNQSEKTANELEERGLLPGAATSRRSFIRAVSLSAFRWQTRFQYEAWRERNIQLKDKTGYGLEGYYINDDGTYDYEQCMNDIQDKIDDGLHWINNKRQWKHDAVHPQHIQWAEWFPAQKYLFIPQ